MSSSNLQVRQQFSTTTINGKKCTAIPRSSSAEGSASAAATSASREAKSTAVQETQASVAPGITTSVAPETTTSIAAAQPSTSEAPEVAATTAPLIAIPAAVTPEPNSIKQLTAIEPEAASSTASQEAQTTLETSITRLPAAPVDPNTSTTEISNIANQIAISVLPTPASKGITPTISSATSRVIAFSDTQPSATPAIVNQIIESTLTQVAPSSTIGAAAGSSTDPSAQQQTSSSVTNEIATTSGTNVMPIMAGVIGSIALVGTVGVLLWFLQRRRRRRSGRNSPLTPLAPPTGEKSYYEIDNVSVGPTTRSVRFRSNLGYQKDRLSDGISAFKASVLGIGASKSKISHERSDSSSVNLNRGNSQFLDGSQMSQHSRSNSSTTYTRPLTTKDRLDNLWARFQDRVASKLRLRSRRVSDPFTGQLTSTREVSEKQGPPDSMALPRLPDLDEQPKIFASDRRRSQFNSGRLSLNFHNDRFTGPSNPPSSNNPFADPIKAPQPTIAESSAYMTDIRRSRGQLIDATTSRYLSTYAPSRDSYRDTFSSTSTRKGKGRSDPFDLERPDFWKPTEKQHPLPVDNRTSRPRVASIARDSTGYDPSSSITPGPLRVQSQSFNNRPPLSPVTSSKYSSGVSSLDGDWGDPGPDLGSVGSRVQVSAVSGSSSRHFSPKSVDVNGSLAEMVLERDTHNVSPMSNQSWQTVKSVGKAM